MRVLLINPPTGRYMRDNRCQAPVDTRVAEPARPPMDLAYMAAILHRAGAKCRIKDYPMEGQGWEAVFDDISSFMPDVLIVSVTTSTIENDLHICETAKNINPQITTIAKGAHFFVFDKDVLERFRNLDVVIRGEPEETVNELVSGKDYSEILGISFRRGQDIIRNPDRSFLDNLDALPLPARDLLNNRLYRTPDTQEPIAFITTGKGCPGSCVFCAAELVSGHKVRIRSVESVLGEIEECVNRYGIKVFFFSADTFTWNKQWVVDFCERIVEKNIKIRWGTNSRVDTLDEDMIALMKKAGCYVIGFGAESGSQFMLDTMKKNIMVAQIGHAVSLCKKHGIESFLVFVIGLPWETKETISETIRFVKNTQASFVEVNVAYPLPGTEFYAIAKENRLFNEREFLGHNYSSPMVRSFSLTTEELRYYRKKILQAFYMRPGYIARRISKINSPSVALNNLRYGLRLIHNLLKT